MQLKTLWSWLWPTLENTPDNKLQNPEDTNFATDVDEASTLLRFLIKEGGRASIPNGIIEDIEAAREIARTRDAKPSVEQRAKLLKAYRDLAAVPRNAIASAKVPPVIFWGAGSHWRSLLIGICFFPFAAGLAALWVSDHSDLWYWAFGYAFVSGLAIWGLYVFTGTASNNKLNQLVSFCYVFTGLALVGSLFP